jgi:hypothetical protein
VVTEIPYQVNKASMLKRMAELVREKKIDGIADMRDESSREGMRVVVELKRDAPAQVVLNSLYKNTQLQESFGIINPGHRRRRAQDLLDQGRAGGVRGPPARGRHPAHAVRADGQAPQDPQRRRRADARDRGAS